MNRPDKAGRGKGKSRADAPKRGDGAGKKLPQREKGRPEFSGGRGAAARSECAGPDGEEGAATILKSFKRRGLTWLGVPRLRGEIEHRSRKEGAARPAFFQLARKIKPWKGVWTLEKGVDVRRARAVALSDRSNSDKKGLSAPLVESEIISYETEVLSTRKPNEPGRELG